MASEKRLIDANALMDAFRKYMVERHDRDRCASEENCKVCDRPCLWQKVVSAAPTVDAVEVVHGRWEHIKDYGGGNCFGYCSHCKTPTKANSLMALEMYNKYCPWCGAKMDGDGNVP